jgi:hypothetical protein
MKPVNSTELSDKNAAASQAGVINGDDPHQTVAEAFDSFQHAYSQFPVGKNGTVDLTPALGESRFAYKFRNDKSLVLREIEAPGQMQ